MLPEHETEWRERGDDVFDVPEFNDNVNVLVFARLLAKERVNTPTAIEPGRKTRGEQGIEQFDHVVATHSTVIPRGPPECP